MKKSPTQLLEDQRKTRRGWVRGIRRDHPDWCVEHIARNCDLTVEEVEDELIKAQAGLAQKQTLQRKIEPKWKMQTEAIERRAMAMLHEPNVTLDEVRRSTGLSNSQIVALQLRAQTHKRYSRENSDTE